MIATGNEGDGLIRKVRLSPELDMHRYRPHGPTANDRNRATLCILCSSRGSYCLIQDRPHEGIDVLSCHEPQGSPICDAGERDANT